MPLPRPDDATREFFDAVLPEDPRILVRPMFGQLGGFINGNMFTGIFGTRVIVRLPEAYRAELLAVPGAEEFVPREGRVAREYVTLPEAWREDAGQARLWLERALAWAASLPPKPPKTR